MIVVVLLPSLQDQCWKFSARTQNSNPKFSRKRGVFDIPETNVGVAANFFFLIFHKFSTIIEHAKRENHPQICSNKQSRVLMQTTTVNCISTSFSHSRNVWQPMAFWRPGTWAAPNGLG
jgi:hypothetical protein